MSQPEMFGDIPTEATPIPPVTNPNEARVNRPIRNQMEMVMRDLDSIIAEDQLAAAAENRDSSSAGRTHRVAVQDPNLWNDRGRIPGGLRRGAAERPGG